MMGLPFFGGVVVSGRIPLIVFIAQSVDVTLNVVVMVRFGILPLVVMRPVSDWLSTFPLTSDLSVWYANKVLITVALVAVATIWSFRHALGGRRLLKAELLDA